MIGAHFSMSAGTNAATTARHWASSSCVGEDDVPLISRSRSLDCIFAACSRIHDARSSIKRAIRASEYRSGALTHTRK